MENPGGLQAIASAPRSSPTLLEMNADTKGNLERGLSWAVTFML